MKHVLDAQTAFLEQGWEDVELESVPSVNMAVEHVVKFTLTFGARRYSVTCQCYRMKLSQASWRRAGYTFESTSLQRILEYTKNELIHYRVHDILKPTFYESRILDSFDSLDNLGGGTSWEDLKVYQGGIHVFGDTALYSSPKATPSSHLTGVNLNLMPPTFLVKRNVTVVTNLGPHDKRTAVGKMKIVTRYYIASMDTGSPNVSRWANVIGP